MGELGATLRGPVAAQQEIAEASAVGQGDDGLTALFVVSIRGTE
jgi:hypothetical protein